MLKVQVNYLDFKNGDMSPQHKLLYKMHFTIASLYFLMHLYYCPEVFMKDLFLVYLKILSIFVYLLDQTARSSQDIRNDLLECHFLPKICNFSFLTYLALETWALVFKQIMNKPTSPHIICLLELGSIGIEFETLRTSIFLFTNFSMFFLQCRGNTYPLH